MECLWLLKKKFCCWICWLTAKACCRQGTDSELFKPNIWPSWFIGHCDRLLLTPHLLTSSLLARGHIWHFVHFASSSPPISFSSSLAFLKFISVPPQFPSALPEVTAGNHCLFLGPCLCSLCLCRAPDVMEGWKTDLHLFPVTHEVVLCFLSQPKVDQGIKWALRVVTPWGAQPWWDEGEQLYSLTGWFLATLSRR